MRLVRPDVVGGGCVNRRSPLSVNSRRDVWITLSGRFDARAGQFRKAGQIPSRPASGAWPSVLFGTSRQKRSSPFYLNFSERQTNDTECDETEGRLEQKRQMKRAATMGISMPVRGIPRSLGRQRRKRNERSLARLAPSNQRRV